MKIFYSSENIPGYRVIPIISKRNFWMKISITFLLLSCLGFQFLMAHNSYGQNLEKEMVTLEVKGKHLPEVLTELEKQVGYRFAYNSSLIEKYVIDLDRDHRSLAKTLDLILNDKPLRYQLVKEKFIVITGVEERKESTIVRPIEARNLMMRKLSRTTFSISGTVTDAEGEPLIGVNIQVKGSSRGTATDFDGNFTLDDIDENAVLVVSYVGFHTQEVPVGGQSVLNIVMVSDAQMLDEVVVVGYGTQRKADLTGSVAVVDVKNLKAQPAASPIEGLQGKATGVQIINDGAPGATPQIRIRGFSTINNNNPLYIIDGVPFEGKLSWLNSSDIESMQVLKDASAASIYGARANNGVVIITTKSGEVGEPKLSLDVYYGTQSPNRNRFPEFLNPQQYAEYVYGRYKNAGKTPGLSGTTGSNYGSDPDKPVLPDYLVAGTKTGHNITAADADPSKYNYSLENPSEFYQITRANKEGTNWFEEITQNAPMQNYQLSISGGTDKSTYALSGGYYNQGGTYKYTHFNRVHPEK